MLVHHSLAGINIRKAVVTTGSFDGVHVGHRTIINRLRTIARENGGESVLVTFNPHPRKVLYPETQGKDLQMITTQREKIRLLDQAGLDHLVIIPFTREFSRTSPVDFIRHILVGKLKADCVVVGFNHYFGHNRGGNYEYLFELGKYYNFTVEEIPEQDIHNEFVSSTKIRKAITDGNIQRANAYLDHEYFILGPLRKYSEGYVNGWDWLEILPEEPEKQLPPAGIYAGSINEPGERVKVFVQIVPAESSKRVLLRFPGQISSVPSESSLFFHKRIRLFNPGEDPGHENLMRDLKEVEELIY